MGGQDIVYALDQKGQCVTDYLSTDVFASPLVQIEAGERADCLSVFTRAVGGRRDLGRTPSRSIGRDACRSQTARTPDFVLVRSGLLRSGSVFFSCVPDPIRCIFPLQPGSSPMIKKNTRRTGPRTGPAPNAIFRSGSFGRRSGRSVPVRSVFFGGPGPVPSSKSGAVRNIYTYVYVRIYVESGQPGGGLTCFRLLFVFSSVCTYLGL